MDHMKTIETIVIYLCITFLLENKYDPNSLSSYCP